MQCLKNHSTYPRNQGGSIIYNILIGNLSHEQIKREAEKHTSTFLINTLRNLHCYLYKVICRTEHVMMKIFFQVQKQIRAVAFLKTLLFKNTILQVLDNAK